MGATDPQKELHIEATNNDSSRGPRLIAATIAEDKPAFH